MKFKQVELPYNFAVSKTQGLTNDLLILNDKYFVKRSKDISKKFLDWNNQINVINLVQNKKFTLPILEAMIDDNKLWILMPYYENLISLANKTIDQATLKALAKLVQELHQVKITNPKIKIWDPIKQLKLYCNLIQPEQNLEKIKNQLINWLKTYQPKKIVLAHNDLVIDNFVYLNQKWYLIDWDFATLNDCLFDIASFASETLTKVGDINYWYQLFNLSEAEITIINKWIKYQNLIWYCWAQYLYQETNNKIYQMIGKTKLANLFQ
ncbi:MAG: phosphotransferase [Spiroplasma sp.]|nr:phosphotransferase [Spiroplasma sp.]